MKHAASRRYPNTSETKIQISINLDGAGKAELASGVPFLDHMLDQIARHGMIDLKVVARRRHSY
jgi:imidazoleglycerol-phosphate dehydratase